MRRTIRIAAALLTDADGRTLLVRKRGTAAFMQPGGKIDPGEMPLPALVRELQEELGLRVDPRAAAYLGRFDAPAANEPDATVVAEMFHIACRADVSPAAEIEEAVWVRADQAEGLALAPLTRDCILPLLARLKPG